MAKTPTELTGHIHRNFKFGSFTVALFRSCWIFNSIYFFCLHEGCAEQSSQIGLKKKKRNPVLYLCIQYNT